MIVSSNQPNFLPYMGTIYKIYKSDVFVMSDDVCFSKSGMHNWNYIKDSNGKRKITVPVNAHHDTKLKDVLVDNPSYSLEKIIKTIAQTYSKSEHFEEGEEILWLISKHTKDEKLKLVDLNKEIILYILKKMKIDTLIFLGDEDMHLTGHKDDRLFRMMEQLQADTYYSGIGAKAYHRPNTWKEKRLNLVYTDYEPIHYEQKYGDFIENLSCIDYIFNEGFTIPKEWRKDGK